MTRSSATLASGPLAAAGPMAARPIGGAAGSTVGPSWRR